MAWNQAAAETGRLLDDGNERSGRISGLLLNEGGAVRWRLGRVV